MKKFFEQYGGVALGILALLVLIAMITPVGNIIKTSLQGTVETFSFGIEKQTDTMTEQMSNAFQTTTEFNYFGDDGKLYLGDELYSGIYEKKIYKNGVLNSTFSNKTISDSGTKIIGESGIRDFILDVNIIYNGVAYGNGISGVRFDVYFDNTLIDSNIQDFCRTGYNLLEYKEIKIVITKVPNDAILPSEPFILKTEDINVYPDTHNGISTYDMYFDIAID